jgi:hypothetical protein
MADRPIETDGRTVRRPPTTLARASGAKLSPASGDRPIPTLAKLGVATIAFGVAFDLVEHTLVSHVNDVLLAGFPIAQHAAHLVVLVGMLVVLAGVIADGMRIQRARSLANRDSVATDHSVPNRHSPARVSSRSERRSVAQSHGHSRSPRHERSQPNAIR